jgi:hypothetical protein
MRVYVNPARNYILVRRVNDAGSILSRKLLSDRRNLSITDRDIARERIGRSNHSPVCDDCVEAHFCLEVEQEFYAKLPRLVVEARS